MRLSTITTNIALATIIPGAKYDVDKSNLNALKATPMTDIRDFAEQAAYLYGTHQDVVGTNCDLYRYQGGLPTTKAAVSEFVKAVYDASLIPDEGRYVAFTLP